MSNDHTFQINKCPVCKNNAAEKCIGDDFRRDMLTINCERCDEYKISERCITILHNDNFTNRQCTNASSKIRQDGNVILTTKNYEQYFNTPNISMTERMDKLLLWLEKKVDDGEVAAQIPIKDLHLQAISWSMDEKDCKYLISLLQERTLINHNPDLRGFHITSKGWEHLEKLKTINPDSAQGFVAMCFGNDEIREKYNTIFDPAIREAGYHPHKVDNREYNNKIDDEVIRQIRRSRFIVTDLTNERPNVYFELGFAEGLGLPVFQICKDGTRIHFDRRQYDTIFWGKAPDKEIKHKLAVRIEAVLGRGPLWKEKAPG